MQSFVNVEMRASMICGFVREKLQYNCIPFGTITPVRST